MKMVNKEGNLAMPPSSDLPPIPPIPTAWKTALGGEPQKPYYQALEAFLESERRRYTIFPPEEDRYNALKLTPLDEVKVVILGQDPYHDNNQAHGLAFSVRPGVQPPPSLQNIFKELHDDVGAPIPKSGYLAPWAEQGVLLLNAVLTVRAHQANSHKGKGWETFTDRVIAAVSAKDSPVVFVLWGNNAQRKRELIDARKNAVIAGPHPSPLSASRGFFGSRPFSKINGLLKQWGMEEIDWAL